MLFWANTNFHLDRQKSEKWQKGQAENLIRRKNSSTKSLKTIKYSSLKDLIASLLANIELSFEDPENEIKELIYGKSEKYQDMRDALAEAEIPTSTKKSIIIKWCITQSCCWKGCG